jgi:hypothetical protein
MIAFSLIAAIALGKAAVARAQDETPDLRMLLNLDLFGRSQEQRANPQASPAPSMLEQIQTLRAMGYLGAKRTASTLTDPTLTGGGANVAATPVPPDDQGVPQL